jgi:hypothetical protein
MSMRHDQTKPDPNFYADKTVSNAILTAVSPEGEFRVMTNFP